ncbi:MAG: FAD-dependent oxidoreductase [Elainellaceae cyanobacterium]
MPSQHNGIFDDAAFTHPEEGAVLSVPVLIAGGSTAAYSAALAALRAGVPVCWVLPQKVIGGQFTAQALSASDDGRLFTTPATADTVAGETFCVSISQKRFRDRQRQLQPVKGQVIDNPGGGWVGPLCTTPPVAATALNEAIAPYLNGRLLTLIPLSDPIEVLFEEPPGERRRLVGVRFGDRQTGHSFTVKASIVIEATDLGDLLELGTIESRVGQEARSETGEDRLPEVAHPECQQAITFDVILERTPTAKTFDIGKPPKYKEVHWLQPEDFNSIHWTGGGRQQWQFFDDFGIFRYRRLVRVQAGAGGPHAPINKRVNIGDVTVLNWGIHKHPYTEAQYLGNDYVFGVLVGVSREERQRQIQQARDRTQAYVYYLQTHGFPNLKPRGDLTWTKDGIALEPYIREARRGIALITVIHNHIAQSFFLPTAARAHVFTDTVGVGQYHYLDIHPNQDVPPGQPSNHVDLPGDDHNALPFTIPLGALIPQNTDGLILSAKSIGTTHITNAVYRMHPVEWAIGEAGGLLAAFALEKGVNLRDVALQKPLLRQFQGRLTSQGIPLFWFDDVAHDDPDFEAIQVIAAAGIIRSESFSDLHFRPDRPVNRAVVATAIVNLLGLELINPDTPRFWDVPETHWAYRAVETLAAQRIISGVGYGLFAPGQYTTRKHLSYMVFNAFPGAAGYAFKRTPRDGNLLKRRELSRVLYAMLQAKLDIVPGPAVP